jgi:hypothetical protein
MTVAEQQSEDEAQAVPERTDLPHRLTLRFETEQDRAFVIHSIRTSKGFSGRVEIAD